MEKFQPQTVSDPTTDERLKNPIHETEDSISYLGVTLEKAEKTDSPFVQKREDFGNFVEDEFSIELQKRIAICLESGQPLLVEGGTSLGKTTTARKMCAELGYEVHYANLNGATDVEDLMGRYIPNPHKKSSKDPEFMFADGKVTSGLRQEEGKIKVIILDEYNSAAPNIVIRLHEVLDALERDGTVVLAEDASEAVSVSKSQTKVIALMNPPGKGYVGREPLDPAQIRRWVYQKLPDKLPKDSFSNYTSYLAGLTVEAPDFKAEEYLPTNAEKVPREELRHIEGMPEIIGKYEEFHIAAQKMLEGRKIAADQPQKFTFDDRMEPARVFRFVQRFYRGDISKTFQEALQYYYTNKLQSETDRKALEGLIEHVRYDAPQNTKRKALEEEIPKEKTGEKTLADLLKEAGVGDESGKILEEADSELAKMKETARRKKREARGESASAEIISAEYSHKDEKGKEVKETIELDFEKSLESYQAFYEKHKIKLAEDFGETMQDIWERNREALTEQVEKYGFDEMILVPGGLSVPEIHAQMSEGYNPTYESSNFKEGGSFAGVKEKTEADRIVLIHRKGAESPKDHPLLKETLGKMAEDLIKSAEALTLTDYLVFQKKFFEETGSHIDSKHKDGNYYWTWLPGSKSGSRVPDARWDPGDGQLVVSAGGADVSRSNLGCRLSRSFS